MALTTLRDTCECLCPNTLKGMSIWRGGAVVVAFKLNYPHQIDIPFGSLVVFNYNIGNARRQLIKFIAIDQLTFLLAENEYFE